MFNNSCSPRPSFKGGGEIFEIGFTERTQNYFKDVKWIYRGDDFK